MAREDDILRSLLPAAAGPLPCGVVGPGDDAAVLPPTPGDNGALVVTCDAIEEGVHFRASWMSLADVAHKLVAVTLSDVAAMGADPLGILVAVAWPAAWGHDAARDLGGALAEACARWDAPLLGGDTDVRPGPLRLEATALGRTPAPLLRSTARAGDGLFVTGPLGGPARAVAAWLADEPLDPAMAGDADALRRFRRPVPRLDAGRALRGSATAAIDLSDGLLPDARRLCEASGLAARIDLDAVPLHPAVPAGRAVELALEGGEDYELLIAGGAAAVAAWPGLVRVGELVAGPAGRVDVA